MQKRGQIALFLIIAVVMLAAFGFGFYYLINSERPGTNSGSYATSTLSLEADTNALNTQIQGCLKDKTQLGINYYGLKDISQDMINNYIAASMDDCINFPYFEKRGYTIARQGLSSKVIISDDAVIATLDYPITLQKGGKSASLENFEYDIKRQKSAELSAAGVADKETRIVTEDGDAEFVIHDGTVMQGANGNQISFNILDKNADGLSNAVVVGKVMYEGLPSGATFSPPITATVRVKAGDVPTQYNAEDLKIAWYDTSTGIWRTYKQLNFYEDAGYYYYSAAIDHFTIIALVACGATETKTFQFLMYNAYISPVQPFMEGMDPVFQPLVWKKKEGQDTIKYLDLSATGDPTEMERAHCVFYDYKFAADVVAALGNPISEVGYGEATAYWTSSLTDALSPSPSGRLHNVQNDNGFPTATGTDLTAAIAKCEYMIQDWDGDDQSNSIPDSQITVPTDNSISKADCLALCQSAAKDKLVSFLKKDLLATEVGGGGAGINFDPDFFQLFVQGPDPGKDTPGDGIKDTAALTCDSATNCKTIADATITDWSTFEDSNFPLATPRVYGYSDTITAADDPMPPPASFSPGDRAITDYVGGYGEFIFQLRDDGNACLDEWVKKDTQNKATLLTPVVSTANPSDTAADSTAPNTITFTPIHTFSSGQTITDTTNSGVSCSATDRCVWTLNNPVVFDTIDGFNRLSKVSSYGEPAPILGQLRAGTNIVGVWVQNTGGDTDANAFASAILQLSGTGVTGQESCDTTVQDRINYLCGCKGSAACPWSDPELKCLLNNRDPNNYDDYKRSLCEIDFTKCPGLGTDGKNFAFSNGETMGGICAPCPSLPAEFFKKSDGTQADSSMYGSSSARCRYCPGHMTAEDNGCLCGVYHPVQYDNSIDGDSAYCCGENYGNEIIKKDDPKYPDFKGCWQTSPLNLVPSELPPGGDTCKTLGTKMFKDTDGTWFIGCDIQVNKDFDIDLDNSYCIGKVTGNKAILKQASGANEYYATLTGLNQDEEVQVFITSKTGQKIECVPPLNQQSGTATPPSAGDCTPNSQVTQPCNCGGTPAQAGKYCCGDATKTISDSECATPQGTCTTDSDGKITSTTDCTCGTGSDNVWKAAGGNSFSYCCSGGMRQGSSCTTPCAQSDNDPIKVACTCEGSPRAAYSGYCCASAKTKGMFKLTGAECKDDYSGDYGCPDGYRDNGYTQCDGKTDGTAFCTPPEFIAFYCKSYTQPNGQVAMKTCTKNCGFDSLCREGYNYCPPADETTTCGDGVLQPWEQCDYAIAGFGSGFQAKCVGDGKYIGCITANGGSSKCTYTDTSSPTCNSACGGDSQCDNQKPGYVNPEKTYECDSHCNPVSIPSGANSMDCPTQQNLALVPGCTCGSYNHKAGEDDFCCDIGQDIKLLKSTPDIVDYCICPINTPLNAQTKDKFASCRCGPGDGGIWTGAVDGVCCSGGPNGQEFRAGQTSC